MFHSFNVMMKCLDLAKKSGQNDIKLVMFQLKYRFESLKCYLEILKSQNLEMADRTVYSDLITVCDVQSPTLIENELAPFVTMVVIFI